MTIEFKTGDLFSENVDAIVNTVNCVGVMGKGIALQFKNKFKANFLAYKEACNQNQISPGNILVYKNDDLLEDSYQYIFNFPTKIHWRSKSEINYIKDGLDTLIAEVKKHNINSIALPALGCGNGELAWHEVKEIISEKLSTVSDVTFVVFQPYETHVAPEHHGKELEMTLLRATLIKTFSELQHSFGGNITRLCMQKIVYFLQVFDYDYGIQFETDTYGPYSKQLKKDFTSLENHDYLQGFSSKNKAITISNRSHSLAEEFLEKNNVISKVSSDIDKIALLIEGFESPLGMELLSTVHFCFHEKNSLTKEKICQCISSWSDRKNRIFDETYIEDTITRLQEDGLINIIK